MNEHGYTCGWCEWGRDEPKSAKEYIEHSNATGHYGEYKSKVVSRGEGARQILAAKNFIDLSRILTNLLKNANDELDKNGLLPHD